jgi:hypothetical protein
MRLLGTTILGRTSVSNLTLLYLKNFIKSPTQFFILSSVFFSKVWNCAAFNHSRLLNAFIEHFTLNKRKRCEILVFACHIWNRYFPYKFWQRKVIPWVLFSKFHRRTNLIHLIDLGLEIRKTTQNFEIWHPKGTPHINSTYEGLKFEFC